MRSRDSLFLLLAASIAVLAACSSTSGPDGGTAVPAEGTYSYSIEWRFAEDVRAFGPDQWRVEEGHLRIRDATRDSIDVAWEVEKYETEADFGFRQGDVNPAYVVWAQQKGLLGTIAHRIWVARGGEPTELECSHRMTSLEFRDSVDPQTGECSLNFAGR